jgi:hypothetical protein
MRTITYEEMDAALAKAVAERGEDYVYEGTCIYVSEQDEPQCGVGCALVGLGLLEQVKNAVLTWQAERIAAGALVTGPSVEAFDQPSATGLFEKFQLFDEPVILDPFAAILAENFQRRQDVRDTWGDALAEARSIVRARRRIVGIVEAAVQ